MRGVSIVTTLALMQSCSVLIQDGVRSSGGACSTSLGWPLADLVIAGGFVYAAATGSDMSPVPPYVEVAEIAAGVFIASAAIGIYKHHNCTRYIEEHPPAVVCGGGARNVGNKCYCADGETFNGVCQGTPDTGNCGGGAYSFGPATGKQCFCLDGFRLDNGQCVELHCNGGAFAQVDQCVCPNGQQWDDGAQQCVVPPEPQQDQGDQSGDQGDQSGDQTAACPEGSVIGGPFSDQCESCPSNMVPGGMYNQECFCPEGTAWDGAQCSVPQAGAPPARRPPPPPRRQPAHRRHHNAPPQQQQQLQQQQPQQQQPQQQQPQRQQPPPRAQPAPNPPYHAQYQTGASQPQDQCRAFTNEPTLNMSACSSFCTGLLAKRLRCQCAPGGC